MLLFITLLLCLWLIPTVNRYLGSTSQKAALDKISPLLGTRITGYAIYAGVVTALALACGMALVQAVPLAVLQTGAFAFFRQRSPRGAFFAITGRQAEGKVNAISAWLVENLYSIPPSIVTSGTREQLVRYGQLYGFWHGLWGLLVGSLPLALFSFAYAPIAALAGGLMGLCYYLAGPYGGIFFSEEGAHERAEYMTGLFVILPFTLLCVLGAAW